MFNDIYTELVPLNDAERLEALEKFAILYTDAEETFDNITHIMAQVFDRPMAFISLVDKDEVFYKSQYGPFGKSKASRLDSLCSLTILSPDPLVIEDASDYECFKDNPLVQAKGGIRFYAGAPITTKEGYAIGAVCVVDTTPGTFTEKEKSLLVRFATMAMHEIEVRTAGFKQKQIQDELNKAQLQLKAALEVGKVTPWYVDLRTNKVYGSAELARMFGVDKSEAVHGLPLDVFVQSMHPQDQDYFWSRWNDAVQLKNDFEAEYRVFDWDKKEHWVLARGRIQYSDKTPMGLTGSLIDITDKKITEQHMSEKNDALSNLYKEMQFVTDTIPQLAWARDKSGVPVFFNKGWKEYTNMDDKELKEKVFTIVHPDDVDKMLNAWELAKEKGEQYEVEYRLKRHDGIYRWFLGRGAPMKDSNGNILKWYGTSTDIEDRKKASQILKIEVEERTKELLKTNQHLNLVNAELEQFNYISNHDLQEPIRKVITFAGMIKTEEAETMSPKSKAWLDKVINAGQRMSLALSDLLNFASLNNQDKSTQVNLNEMVQGVLIDLELVIEEKGAKVTIEALPTIKAIPYQMRQLFYNLISNSLKFSRTDIRPTTLITCKKRNLETGEEQENATENNREFFEITVKDNGIGFDQLYEQKIFKIFQRLHTKHAYPGTGIGLALCKKVVTNHDGKIWAHGEEGKGATFTVLLPASF